MHGDEAFLLSERAGLSEGSGDMGAGVLDLAGSSTR
jgi:hypothetical protein